jgi:SEC-C motif domain protein
LASAAHAEDVMRARYTAYVRRLERFLLESWHPSTCPGSLAFDPSVRWSGLTVVATDAGGPFDAAGEVSFVAAYTRRGAPGTLAERSRFERLPAGWVYVEAVG